MCCIIYMQMIHIGCSLAGRSVLGKTAPDVLDTQPTICIVEPSPNSVQSLNFMLTSSSRLSPTYRLLTCFCAL